MSGVSASRMQLLGLVFAWVGLSCGLSIGCSGGAADPQWSGPEQLDSGSPSYSPVLVAGIDGRTLAVWRGPNPEPNPLRPTGSNGLFASWKTPGGRWGTSAVLDDFRSLLIFAPSVAMGPKGDAVVVWVQPGEDDEADEVWVRRYEPGTSWAAPEQIGVGGAGTYQGPRVAIGADGRAFAAWMRPTTDGEEIALSEWSGERWAPRESFSIDQEATAWLLDFGIDANGCVAVVWWAGGTWVNRFTTEAGWGSAAELVDDELVGWPSVDVDAQGRSGHSGPGRGRTAPTTVARA